MQVPDVLQTALKDDRSALVLIPHARSVRAQTLHVPVGDAGDVGIVGAGTVVVILLAFVYLLWTIVRASRAQRVAVEVPATKKDS
jgi:PIG-X / PBN1